MSNNTIEKNENVIDTPEGPHVAEEVAAVEAEQEYLVPAHIYNKGQFDNAFAELMMEDPFLGGVSIPITKVIDEKCPTAYIGCRPNGKGYEVYMGFNPEFFGSLTKTHRKGVIRHELYHFIFNHIFSRAVGETDYALLQNWATDMAINSILGANNLPRMCIVPGQEPIDPKTGKPVEGEYAEFIKNAKPMQSSDYYFEELRKIQDKQGKGESAAQQVGIGTMDDHGKWGEMDQETEDFLRDKAREILEKAARNAEKTNNWGSVPSEIQDVIKRLISNEIDWRSLVKNFIGRCRTMERHSSIRLVNKKYPYIHPGVRRPFKAKFACFIDQSGSMSDDDIALLFSELDGLAKETEIDIFFFDTEVDERSKMTWKRGNNHPRVRVRQGGTDFDCVSKYCNDPRNSGNNWSGIIVLTDGYAPTMGVITRSKVLWVITETGTMESVRRGDLAVQMKAGKQFKRY